MVFRAICLGCGIMIVAVVSWFNFGQPRPAPSDYSQPVSAADTCGATGNGCSARPTQARTFSKEEFDTHVFQKTKAQIRAEFGSPDTTNDAQDEWVYFHLPVIDTDAGIQMKTVVITFDGEPAPDDAVALVRYP